MDNERRDESVQFSLKELLELEDQRLAEQKAREAMRVRETAEAEERRKREAEARALSDQAEAASRQRAELDALAKREAMQRAVIEQARLEVEVRARGEERERERRHEIELERLRKTETKPAVGALAGSALLGGVVMLGVMLGVHFGVVKPAADRHVADLGQEAAEAKTRAFDLAKTNEEQRRTNAELKGSLDRAEKALAAARETAPKTAPPGAHPTSPTPVKPNREPPPHETPCINKWDPMCGVIGH